jgi:hypothetical protein
MSSGTQIELDWTGVDAAQGGAAAPPASVANGAGAEAGTYPTDEEILEIDPPSPKGGYGGQAHGHAGNAGTESTGSQAPFVGASRHGGTVPLQPTGQDATTISSRPQAQPAPAMPEWMRSAAGDPKHGAEAQQLWQEHQAFRASFSSPDEARAIRELFPGGAQEAQALRQAAQELGSLRQAAHAVDQLDAAIYSGDARAQSEVVAELARANPAAFRQLFAEAAKVLATLPVNAPVAGSNPGSKDPGYNNTGRTQPVSHESRITSHESPVTDHESPVTNHAFDPAAYAAFERSTNDVVAQDVRAAVGDTLARVLPEGIAEGAARRIGEDIFNEIHRTLAADRSLSEQVSEVLRGWRFGTAEQQRIASLLAGRAKQLVPGVARRVIGEWTSSVLGASRSKAARQAAAAARVDIAAPGGSLDSMPLRPMSGREIDYASMSDDEILSL